MANICMILGKSGTGKSTSIKTLDPKETMVINTLKKRLPFKGSATMYSKENNNLREVETYIDAIDKLNKINKMCSFLFIFFINIFKNGIKQ